MQRGQGLDGRGLGSARCDSPQSRLSEQSRLYHNALSSTTNTAKHRIFGPNSDAARRPNSAQIYDVWPYLSWRKGRCGKASIVLKVEIGGYRNERSRGRAHLVLAPSAFAG